MWPGGWALAKEMAEHDIEGKTFLEIGCGLALASLVLNHRGASVQAMDYHPEAAGFLMRNTTINNDPEIPFNLVDWTRPAADIVLQDVIIAADVLYEDEHAAGIATYIDVHLARDGLAIVADPRRGHGGLFRRQMEDTGFNCEQHMRDDVQIMHFRRRAVAATRS